MQCQHHNNDLHSEALKAVKSSDDRRDVPRFMFINDIMKIEIMFSENSKSMLENPRGLQNFPCDVIDKPPL